MNIPTAAYRKFSKNDLQAGLDYIATQTPPIVLKADGLAAGKGVIISPTVEEAQAEFKEMLSGKFGAASETIVIEQFLKGLEFSVFVLTDSKEYKILPVAKDYKKIGEGDTGLNTGGMGAISPPPFVDKTMMDKVESRIIKPTIEGLKKRNIDYKGFIFIGLIEVEGEPYVIEYNCRMGDPETEVVLPRLKNDMVDLMASLFDESLKSISIKIDPRTAATVMLVSGGYPEKYEKGKKISGLKTIQSNLVFHAGTKETMEGIVTNGGRVMALTSFGESLHEAVGLSLISATKIEFEKKHYRRDIGFEFK